MSGGTLSIDMWQCPNVTTCDGGQIVNGHWASYGCIGHVASISTCTIYWHDGTGGHACPNACSYLGKARVN